MTPATAQNGFFRILVVDDEPALHTLLQRTFRKRGHECDTACNGSEALALFRKRPYDVVVTDLRMPDVHGHSLSVSLLEAQQPPGIVVVTGVAEPRLATDLKARGVDEILYKPVDPNELIPVVEAIAWKRGLGGAERQLPATDSASRQQNPPTDRPAASSHVEDDLQTKFSLEAVSSAGNQEAAGTAECDCRVAILLDHIVRTVEYAEAIRSDEIDAVPCESTDTLSRLLDSDSVDIIVMQQDLGGFLTGLEILERLRRELSDCEFILLADSPDRVQSQADIVGVHSILEASADPSEVLAAVNTLRQSVSSEEEFIPHAARRLAEKCSDIPPLPQVLVKLLRYMEMDLKEIPIDQLAKDIAVDARATADLLRLANSASVGARLEIVRVADAVTLLGPKRTISLVFSAAVMQTGNQFVALSPDFRQWFQQRCVLIATTASAFAERFEDISPEMVFTIGTLQEIGMLALASRGTKNYLSLIERVRTTGVVHLERMEQEELGMTHADVGAALLQRWELPRSIVQPVLNHHTAPTKSQQQQKTATAFNRVLRIGEAVADLRDVPQPTRQNRLNSLLSEYGASNAESCRTILQQAAVRTAETSRLFSAPVPDVDTLRLLLEQAF